MDGVAVPAAPSAVRVSDRVLGGVPCVVCEPALSERVALYLHGGGYRLGSAQRSTPFAARLAEASASTVVVVDYRLAPENPFPAGLLDAVAVYEAVLDAYRRAPALVGDSAGAGLAAAVTVAAARSAVTPPQCLALMSPWLDLTCSASTYESRAGSDQLFSLASAREAAAMYLQGYDPTDPLVSPGLAELDSWPPILVFASTDEVLLDDSLSFVSSLALRGHPVTCDFEAGVPHAWPAVFPDLPGSAKAVQRIVEFLASVPNPPAADVHQQ
jgi:acetyl esterase/lipase